MRDIRDDLKQRIGGLQAQRDQLQAQLEEKLAEIAEYEAQLSNLLALEERRVAGGEQLKFAGSEPRQKEAAGAGIKELEAEIMKILARGLKHRSDIKQRLEQDGWVYSKGSFGRVLQGLLLSLKSRGMVEYRGNGMWEKVGKANAA